MHRCAASPDAGIVVFTKSSTYLQSLVVPAKLQGMLCALSDTVLQACSVSHSIARLPLLRLLRFCVTQHLMAAGGVHAFDTMLPGFSDALLQSGALLLKARNVMMVRTILDSHWRKAWCWLRLHFSYSTLVQAC